SLSRDWSSDVCSSDLRSVASNDGLVMLWNPGFGPPNGKSANSYEPGFSEISVQLMIAELDVTSVTDIDATVLIQVVTQSTLRHGELSTVCMIRIAGCSPNPFAKLIPTPLMRWQ